MPLQAGAARDTFDHMNDKSRSAAILEGRVRDVAQSGDAVVETERGIVFARGGLPGERLRLRLARKAGGAQRGELVERIATSPDRVEPVCPIAPQCGGCPLMALAEPAQARLKRGHLQRVLDQLATGLEAEWIGSPQALGYRARARLGWKAQGRGGARIGYRAAGSHALVDAPSCAVLAPALGAGLSQVRARLAPLLAGEGELWLGLGANGGCVAALQSEQPQPEPVYAAAAAIVGDGTLEGLSLRAGGAGLTPARFGDPRQATRGVDGAPLYAGAAGFTQVNPELNARLVARVVELAQPAGAKLLELFAGHGNFTVALAPVAAELIAVEADREAAGACRENLAARGLAHARVVCADAAEGARGRGPVDIVVLDPPRSGARAALPALLARRPRRIVYVSCDLPTLQRDLATLLAGGYRADAAAAFDMFPQTGHLESAVRLVRAR